MFSEKNIPKLIILTPLITVLLVAFFVTYFFVQNQYNYFQEESIRLESEYLIKQKEILKKETNDVISYIMLHEDSITKEAMLSYIDSIRYEDNGYIWIHDTNFKLISNPFRPESIGIFDKFLQDSDGKYIIQMFVENAIKYKDGAFIEYSWAKPNKKEFAKKLGFVKHYEKLGWVIGSGLYMEDIECFLQESKRALEARIQKYINTVVLFSIAAILILSVLSFMIAQKTSEAFSKYNEEKERAMFHQSRLARMGVMISMIAHQWRQPLTELSSILMEIETTIRFKKANEFMLQESIKESEKLIDFMSNTIDDFRNFFKPDKEAKHFEVDKACLDACNLIDATLHNSGIALHKHFISNVRVFGYQREFSQVIINLLTNAKDILLEREIKNPTISISTKKEIFHVIISVEDNAQGVNKEIGEKIFEPYFSTKNSTQGSGLGLYISKMIIEKNMEGELRYENTSHGAKFTIRIACEG